MPLPTPFHARTAARCDSLLWKDWAGCYAVRSYDTSHEREYFAIRYAAGLIDVSPLHKYEVHGPDAGRLLAGVMVRDVGKLKVGRVTYLCWCDDDGKVLDDGTVCRLDRQRYRVTSNQPALAWLRSAARSLRVTVEDVSSTLGALALQGPCSRDILARAAGSGVAGLKFFGMLTARIGAVAVEVSRTGYTGDLGYEVWVGQDGALAVYDALLEAGKPYRIEPAGLDAMDVARIEAGFILNGVDYFSANRCLIESRKSTPYEIGLGWAVRTERDPFIGQAALRRARARGPRRELVGLVYDWDEYEALHARFGLPPGVPRGAWRDAVPVRDARGRQVGQATSGAWSPVLKQKLALASVDAAHARPGRSLQIEVTVEYERHFVGCRVAATPFFDPERKRA